jgi:arginase
MPTLQPGIVVIDAPSNLGLRPPKPGVEPGVKGLAAALRKTGLVERLRARDAGTVAAPAYSPVPDLAVGFRNGTSLSRYSAALAAKLEALLAGTDFVLVLGGDCSVLVGAGVALKGRGRYGLAFIDGHDDYSYARDRERYRGIFAAAGLDLALATGNGPPELSDIHGRKPYFRTEDVLQIGLAREQADTEFATTETFETSGIRAFPVEEIAQRGARAVAADARSKLEGAPTQGFWIHLDADVLNAKIMPAVDSPNPRGLSFEQLEQILAQLLSSPKAIGLEITIFDPDLDPDGTLAAKFAKTIEAAFIKSGRIKSLAK